MADQTGSVAGDVAALDGSTTANVDEYLEEAGLKAKLSEASELRGVGMKLIAWLLILIGVSLALITLIAIITYPSQADTLKLVGKGSGGETPTAIETYRQLRDDWASTVKDLAQLLVVSLFVPLLATIIGHVFTRSSEQLN